MIYCLFLFIIKKAPISANITGINPVKMNLIQLSWSELILISLSIGLGRVVSIGYSLLLNHLKIEET